MMSPIKYQVSHSVDRLSGPEPTKKYYPLICEREPIGIRQIASRIALKSTLSTPDVVGVLEALVQEVPELLMDNHSINLEGLGNFRLYAKSDTCLKESEVNSKLITGVKVGFLPSVSIKKRLKGARYVKV